MADFFPANSAALTAALNACTFGDFIYLVPGTVYVPPPFGWTLVDKGVGSSYITITTSDLGSLPAKLAQYPSNFSFTDETQYRITTAEAANMPKLVTADGYPIFFWGHGAHHWKIVGVEFTNTSTFTGYLVGDQGGQSSLDELATDNWIEYCFFHPKEEVGFIDVDYVERSVEKGLGYNGDNLIVRNCAIQGFTGYDPEHTYKLDTNAIIYGLGRGGVLVENCLLEGQSNNLWLGGGGGGFPYPDWQGTVSGATSTTATFSNVTNLDVGMLFGVFLQEENDMRWTAIEDPNGTNPVALVAGYAVGKVTEIDGLDVTFEQLTSGVNFRRFRLKFGTGTYGGSFTLNYRGQTTSAITFPTAATIASANQASPTQVTTSAPHGLATGNFVTISGMSGGVDDGGYDLNRDWTITVTGASTFTLNSSGTRSASSGAGKVRSRTALQTNVLNALVALSNLAPADITSVSGSELYVQSPTFGVTIDFAASVDLMLTSDLVVNGASLTGSGVVSSRIEPAWTEGYSNVHPDVTPNNGAVALWGGLQPVGVTIRRNIIPKYPLWLATMGQQKGFGEFKVGEEFLFEGNIFAGQATGMILEVKNQSGAAPWSTIRNVTFQNNLWTDTGAPIAWAAADGANRTTPGSGLTVTNNLFLNPGSPDSYFFGNSNHGGTDVTVTHNTIFEPSRMTFVVVGTTYDGPEVAGFSQEKEWTVRDNFILYRGSFFSWYNDTPLNPPYDYGDIRDAFFDMTADHNAIINDFLDPEDKGGFFANFPDNWKIDAAISTIGFVDAPEALDYTGNYRLEPSSIYAAGNARDASDGTDIGVNYATLIAGLGFDPWGGSAQSVTVSGHVVLTGGVVLS